MVLGFGGSDNDITITIKADGTSAVSEINKVDKSIDGLKTSSSDFIANAKNFAGAFGIIAGGATAVLGSITGLAASLGSFAARGEELGSLTATFERLGGSAASIDKAKEASIGLISQVDLLKTANRALLLDIPDLDTNLVKIADAGARLGNALGIDATDAVNQLTQAIGKGEQEQLKQLGLLIDAQGGFQAYADSLGVAVGELTEFERASIKQNLALEALDEFLGRTDEATNSAANSYIGFKNTLQDTIAEISIAVNENENLAQAFQSLSALIIENKDEFIALAGVLTQGVGAAFKFIVEEAANVARGLSIVRNELAELASLFAAVSQSGIGRFIGGIKDAGVETLKTAIGFESASLGLQNLQSVFGIFSEREAKRMVASLQATEQAAKQAADPFNNLGEEVNKVIVGPVAALISQFDSQLPRAVIQAKKSLQEQAQATQKVAAEALLAAEAFKDFGDAIRDELGISERAKELIEFENALFDIVKQTSAAEQQTEAFAQAVIALKSGFENITNDEALRKLQEIRDFFDALENQPTVTTIRVNLDAQFGGQGGDLFGIGGLPIFQELQEALANLGSGGGGFTAIQQVLNQLGSLASSVFDTITGLFDGSFSGREGTQDLVSTIFGGLGEAFGVPILGDFVGDVVNTVIGAFDGATKQVNTLARRAIETVIDEALAVASILIRDAEGNFVPFTDLILGDKDRFGPAFDEIRNEFQASAPAAFDQFEAVGGALGAALGNGFADGALVGAVLFEQFGGDIDSLRLLVQTLGVDFETLKNGVVSAFLAGEIGALDAASAIRDLGKAFEPGLEAVGAYDQALRNLVDSGGRGRTAIKSLQDVAIEAIEAGATSFEDLRQRLLASGQFTDQEINSLFQALEVNGVQSLEALANASDELAIALLGNLEAQGGFFSQISEGLAGAEESVRVLNDQLNEINGTEVQAKLRIDVSTNFDSPESRDALRQVTQGEGIGSA